MHRIDGPGATADQKFTEGDPVAAIPATEVTDRWLTSVQEEIAAVIESQGIALNPENNAQLLAAIQAKISAAIPSNVPQGVRGSFSNLKLSASGTSAAIAITADDITLRSNSSSSYLTISGVALSVSLATSGANGLDSGTSAASTWYCVWAIWNGTTAAGLLSLSATAPTMPAGYTHKALVGVVRTDATANKYPLSFRQDGHLWQYKVAAASNLAAMPLLASGVGGNPSIGPTWSPLAIGNFAPPSASEITLVLSTTVAGATAIIVAPSNAYGTYNSPTNPPPGGLANGSFLPGPTQARFMLEGANIYWAADRAEARIYITSFELNL